MSKGLTVEVVRKYTYEEANTVTKIATFGVKKYTYEEANALAKIATAEVTLIKLVFHFLSN